MKEMIYGDPRHDAEVLHEDVYKSYKFYIVSYGTHPCCYVELPGGSPYYEKDYDDIPVSCHGGLTFCGPKDFANFGWCIGWDFAHYDDFYGIGGAHGHKWTTEELLDECINVIDQLVTLTLSDETRLEEFYDPWLGKTMYYTPKEIEGWKDTYARIKKDIDSGNMTLDEFFNFIAERKKAATDLSYGDVYDFTHISKEDKEKFFNELFKKEEPEI